MALEVHISLVEACQKGSQKAQMQLYKIHVQEMYNSAYRLLKNKESAEDIVQDSFIVSFEKIHQCKEENHYKNWLKKIVINKSIDELKKQNKIKFVTDENLTIENAIDDEDTISSHATAELVLYHLGEMPEQHRIMLQLFYFENFSHQEIAEQLQTSYENSRIMLHRAKQHLKKRLENENKQFA